MDRKGYLVFIILFIILIVVASVIPNIFMGECCDLGINYGFPLNFYGYGGGPGLDPSQPIPQYFHVFNLVGDILVWLIVSFVIALAYTKVRKR